MYLMTALDETTKETLKENKNKTTLVFRLKSLINTHPISCRLIGAGSDGST